MSVHAPVASAQRLSHIDMVRGYALLGVLLMNIHYWFRNPPQPYWLGGLPFSGSLDLAVHRVLQIGFEAKSVTMFSMLFALGLCMQRERALEKGISWGVYATRRMWPCCSSAASICCSSGTAMCCTCTPSSAC
jgi:uncharacterized protein